MKKITVIASLFIAALTTSCAKKHTCTCTTVTAAQNGVPSTSSTRVTTYDKITEANAKLACETQSSETDETAPVVQAGDKTTCTLK